MKIILTGGRFFWDCIFDAHVKSPFYMDLGIQEVRNCELL